MKKIVTALLFGSCCFCGVGSFCKKAFCVLAIGHASESWNNGDVLGDKLKKNTTPDPSDYVGSKNSKGRYSLGATEKRNESETRESRARLLNSYITSIKEVSEKAIEEISQMSKKTERAFYQIDEFNKEGRLTKGLVKSLGARISKAEEMVVRLKAKVKKAQEELNQMDEFDNDEEFGSQKRDARNILNSFNQHTSLAEGLLNGIKAKIYEKIQREPNQMSKANNDDKAKSAKRLIKNSLVPLSEIEEIIFNEISEKEL